MTVPQKSYPFYPYKSPAIGLLFSLLLGPLGLLYASFWGGIIMTLIGIIVVSSQLIFPIILLWIICCIWSVKAIDNFNRKILTLTLNTH